MATAAAQQATDTTKGGPGEGFEIEPTSAQSAPDPSSPGEGFEIDSSDSDGSTPSDPPTPPPAQPGTQGYGLLTGAAQAVGDTVNTVSKLINKIPGIGETLAPSAGIKAADTMETPTTTPEKIGYGLENIGEFMLGDEALKGLSLGDKLLESGKIAKAIENFPKLKKAIEIGMTAMRGGTVAGTQTLAHGGTPSEALTQGATAAGAGAAAGLATEAVRSGVNALRSVAPDVPGAVEDALGSTPASVGDSGPSRAEAGATQQQAAQRIKQAQGAEVAATKEAARPEDFTLQLGPHTDFGQKMSDIAEEVGGTEDRGLQSLKDPQMSRIADVVKELNPAKSTTLSNQQIDDIRDQLNAEIAQQKIAVKAGNVKGTALKYLTQVKSAFDDEMYGQIQNPDLYRADNTGTGGTATAAQAAEDYRAANKQYAQTTQRQSKGPAASIFKAMTPEKVIQKLNSGAVDGTTAREFIADKTPEEIQSLQKGLTKDLIDRTSSHGEKDYEKAWNLFDKQREAKSVIYGNNYDRVYNDLRENAAKQNITRIVGDNTTGSKTDWKATMAQFEQQPNGKLMYGSDYNDILSDMKTKVSRQAKQAVREERADIVKKAAIGTAATAAVGGGIYGVWEKLKRAGSGLGE